MTKRESSKIVFDKDSVIKKGTKFTLIATGEALTLLEPTQGQIENLATSKLDFENSKGEKVAYRLEEVKKLD